MIDPRVPFGIIIALFIGLAATLIYLEARTPPVYVAEPKRSGPGAIVLGLAIVLAAVAVTLFLPG